MKKFMKCAFLTLVVVLTFEYTYIAATWIMDGGLAAQEATESMVKAQGDFLFVTVIGNLAK